MFCASCALTCVFLCSAPSLESDKMPRMKPLAQHMEEMGIGMEQLVAASGLEAKTVQAIATGNYTASPSQRQRLHAVLNLATDGSS